MATEIHPTAIVCPGAELDESVSIGPYAYIGPEVRLGAGCRIHHHATVEGSTVMGTENEVFPYACIGGKTHDLKWKGGATWLRVGNRNTFREYTTAHRATNDGDATTIGNDNVILAYSHIAHDCQIADRLVMSSHAALGGHVVVDDSVTIGWGAGVHQFCRLGRHSMVAAMAKQVQDLLPFVISEGAPAAARAVNRVGMERSGFDSAAIGRAQQAYRIVFREGLNRSQAIARLQEKAEPGDPVFAAILAFFEASSRGVA